MSERDNKFTQAENGAPDIALAAAFPKHNLEEWRASVEVDLKGVPFDKKLLWQTPEGFTVKPLYTEADLNGVEHLGGLPGVAPYARGAEPLAGVLPRIQIRQDCVLAAPEHVNAALRDGIARGQNAIGIRLDNAARRGLDGDHPDAAEKAGFGGVTISSINGVRIALQDIDLIRHPISWRSGAAALPILAMHMALAEERGIDSRLLTGSVECDPVRELVKTGHVRGQSIELRFREMAELVHWCARHSPGVRPVVVNSHHWHNAGATAVQELAYTLATGVEYLRRLAGHGIKVNTAALGMIFSYSVSTNLFMEIAKLRAARLLWAKACKAMGVTDESAEKMFMHARTSVVTKSKLDPYNNLIRSSVEAFAASVGGCDSLYVAPFDEMVGLPDEFSMRLARNQQLLLQEEVHLDRVVDPSGGSYLVESLTDSLAKAAWKLFQEVEAEGGIVASLKTGSAQRAVEAKADKRRAEVAGRRQSIVGVSNYANPAEVPLLKSYGPRADFLSERRRRISRLKSIRRNVELRQALWAITTSLSAVELGMLMPLTISAAAAGATIGEITDALNAAAVPGEVMAVKPLRTARPAEPFEVMRARVQAHHARTGNQPAILLLSFGPGAMRRARADFAKGFFTAAGFRILEAPAVKTAEDGALALTKYPASVIVACSDDATYPEFVPKLIERLAADEAATLVFVAGNPESAPALTAAGVAGFIHVRSDVVAELTALLDRLAIH